MKLQQTIRPIMTRVFLLLVVRQKLKPISKAIEVKGKRHVVLSLTCQAWVPLVSFVSFKDQRAADFLLRLCSCRTCVTPSDSCTDTGKRPRGPFFSASGCSGVYPCLAVFACAFASPDWARQDNWLYLCSQWGLLEVADRVGLARPGNMAQSRGG